MTDQPRCFVAYPSTLPAKGDAIEMAVTELNAGGLMRVKSWISLAISGRPVIGAICQEIRTCDILIADVTNLNPNVLFELGYAITQRKRLWLLFNPQVAGAKVLFDRFQLLTTIGYCPYNNSRDITTKLYEDEPYKDLDGGLYDELAFSTSVTKRDGSLLYIKPAVSTEAVMRVARRVSAAPLPSVIDDPKEIGVQPMEWYLASVTAARGIICHFLSDDYDDAQITNAKSAFVGGLAYGLEKPLLMLAHSPYNSPIDYRDILRTHQNATQAEAIYQAWLSSLLEADREWVERKSRHVLAEKAYGGLLDLNIGDPIAEYEPEEILEYFVPTSPYREATKAQHSIFVGRKGTGKTATLLKVADHLESDPRNHVCVIKPVDYELEGLVALLQKQMGVSEKGFLVESFWKALIYTELAKSVYEKLHRKPEYLGRLPAEQRLLDYVLANEEVILPEFSMRLENLVKRLAPIAEGLQAEEVKRRVSEQVHRTVINQLKDLLINALEKVNAVSILVDNLDKSWTPRTNIQLVSELLFGLLSVAFRIAEDFRKSSLGKRRLDIMMILFIRSDIYASIVAYAREPDKLPVRRIEWNDPELLVRVIERRIMVADKSLIDNQEVWAKYFVDRVHEIPTKDFLVASTFPRPRDLIYLVRASLQHAVNRGHTTIEQRDIESGLEQYSSFVFDSLLAEGAPQFRQLQDFMVQLFGGPTILTEDDVREALEEANLGITNASFVIDLLQDLTFLGFETSPNRFTFCHDREQKPKLTILSKKTARLLGKRRLQVHEAFHAYLELKSVDTEGQMPIAFNRPAN
jgi:hypothetical protein